MPRPPRSDYADVTYYGDLSARYVLKDDRGKKTTPDPVFAAINPNLDLFTIFGTVTIYE